MGRYIAVGRAGGTTRHMTGRYSYSRLEDGSFIVAARCIIKLGTLGTIIGFDIDTSHFNGKSVVVEYLQV